MQTQYQTRCEEITIADLTLDQWKPITPQQFTAHLTDNSFYDGEFFIPPVVWNFDLQNNANALVYCFAADIDHEAEDTAIMVPMLLVLSTWKGGERDDVTRNYLCFVRT